MKLEGLSDLQLNDIEYCFLVGDHSVDSKEFRVRNPKLTPLIDTSKVDSKNIVFNSSIFINSSKARPSINKKIHTQNYITVKKSNNCTLDHLAINGIIPHNTRVRCICNNNNINDMIIIDG